MPHKEYHLDLYAPFGPPKGTKDYTTELRQRAKRKPAIEALPEFYGAAAQITVSKFPNVTVADITTPTGAKIAVQHNRIRLKSPGRGAMAENTLLADSMWGRAFAAGHIGFQREAVAYGKALGVEIVARNQPFFSEEDRQWVDRRASELKASGLGPDHPCKHPQRSWVHYTKRQKSYAKECRSLV